MKTNIKFRFNESPERITKTELDGSGEKTMVRNVSVLELEQIISKIPTNDDAGVDIWENEVKESAGNLDLNFTMYRW